VAPTAPRILLTRSEEDCSDWAEQLAARGAVTVSLPCIRCEPIDTPALREAFSKTDADWLVFTSRRGVEAAAALGAFEPGSKIAVVGAATAAAARERFGHVELVGAGTGAKLAAQLVEGAHVGPGDRVLLLLAENASDTLERTLETAGASVTRLDVYRTVPAPSLATKRAMSALDADNVLLASPSAVTGFVRQVVLDVPIRVFTIGPSTTAAARAAGLAVTAEAPAPSLEGLLEAMQWQT
jgi:uroporphyrinogen-III synthase